MIRIDAIIKPHKLEEVQKALLDIGVQGMTVSDVKGFGRQKGHTEMYRGAEYRVDFIPKLMVSLVIPESSMEAAISSIQKAASSGKIGDGKIFVSRIDNVVRIRTGETGRNAI
jgi:nitrogen regulatory protein P-II 1